MQMDPSWMLVLERGTGSVLTLSLMGIASIGLRQRLSMLSGMSILLWLHGSRGSTWMYPPPKLQKTNRCRHPILQRCCLHFHPYQHLGHHHLYHPCRHHRLVLFLSSWRHYLSLNLCLNLYTLTPRMFESHRLGSGTFSQKLEFPPLARLTR